MSEKPVFITDFAFFLPKPKGQIERSARRVAGVSHRSFLGDFTAAGVDLFASATSAQGQQVPRDDLTMHDDVIPSSAEVFCVGPCVSGLSALWYARLNVASGRAINAVAAGTTLPRCRQNRTGDRSELNSQSLLAGAAFLTVSRPAYRQALRIDWLEREGYRADNAANLLPLISRHSLTSAAIDWFLPFYSFDYFRQELYDHLRAIGFEIPAEKWFTNLYEKGNTGAASIYITLEELFHSGRLRTGHRLFCLALEDDGRSIFGMHLTVV